MLKATVFVNLSIFEKNCIDIKFEVLLNAVKFDVHPFYLFLRSDDEFH